MGGTTRPRRGLPLEFSVVTPQMVGPDVKALDRFVLLKAMKTYKMNLKSPRPMHRLTAVGVILTESPLSVSV